MRIVIFSRNRAMQLELLLRSIYKHCLVPYHIYVIWSADGEHEEAYFQLWDQYEDVVQVPDRQYGGIQPALDRVLAQHGGDTTMLLVDDAVLRATIRDTDKPFADLRSDPRVENISMRLYSGITYCYAYDKKQRTPDVSSGGFEWRGCEWDWGYPNSIDGTVYLNTRLQQRLYGLQWGTPNDLEVMLARKHKQIRPRIAVYPNFAPVLTVPDNRVQDAFHNRCGSGTVDQLNQLFLEGKRIRLEPFESLRNDAVHVGVPYEFE